MEDASQVRKSGYSCSVACSRSRGAARFLHKIEFPRCSVKSIQFVLGKVGRQVQNCRSVFTATRRPGRPRGRRPANGKAGMLAKQYPKGDELDASRKPPSGSIAFFLFPGPVIAIFLDRTGTQDRVQASGGRKTCGSGGKNPLQSRAHPKKAISYK
jgi:hypothetical protein